MAQLRETISEDVERELQDAVSIGGVLMLKDLIQQKNNKWKNIPLNIAISGVSGVGKSSFINTFRGITAEDEGGAPVGATETTMRIKQYIHPKYSSMVIWDLPGVGTTGFPKGDYLRQVEFKKYDFFLILSAGRFRDDDLWLAKEIRSLEKNFHFVRTHINDDVENDKKGHPRTHSKANVIERVRDECQSKLKDNNLTRASLFLIDNYLPKDYDFDSLTRTLIDEAPNHKREAMILSMSVLTDGVIERKVEALQRRIYLVSLWSAVGGGVPIPVLSTAVDMAILIEEVNFYKSQLGLDRHTINEYARFLNIKAENIREKLGLQGLGLATTAKGLTELMSIVASSDTIESTLPIIIPIAGSLIAAGISYGVTVKTLQHYLGILAKDARKVNEELLKKLA